MDDPEDDLQPSVNLGPELYTSVKALADALHISRPTVYAWFKLPGCPAKRPDGAFDAAAWRAFARTIGTKTEAAGEDADDKTALQAEELRLKNEQRRKAIQRADGLWTLNEQIEAELAPLVQEAIALLRAKFENELPTLYTTDAAANLALNKAAIDEVCARLNDPLPCQGGAAEA